ncbi:MAG: response regulator transcription factor [Syntrophales bacterium]
MRPFRIILADDHALFRNLMKNSIATIPDFQIVGEASDGFELLELLKKSKPDLVILDITMPNLQGIEAAKEIKKTYPEIKIMILTMHKSKDHLRSALAAGVEGYLLKEDVFEDLITAIRSIQQGKNYLSSLVSARVREILVAPKGETGLTEALTTREIVILKLLAEGKSSQEIAGLLFISVDTVNRHRFNIREKLNIKSTAELIKYAIQKGYTSLD